MTVLGGSFAYVLKRGISLVFFWGFVCRQTVGGVRMPRIADSGIFLDIFSRITESLAAAEV